MPGRAVTELRRGGCLAAWTQEQEEGCQGKAWWQVRLETQEACMRLRRQVLPYTAVAVTPLDVLRGGT